ncbi:MAG: vitamin K epoxide reductase family protein [Snowella sp.]|nr:vitamin K epoxide reductase family protein [Snowella sp.]
MVRRRSVPWIYRYSRFIMGAIAVIGSLITAYLTVISFTGGSTACPVDPAVGVSSCDLVLQSSYAKVFGLPLSLFGLLAYLAMVIFALSPFLVNAETNKQQRTQLEKATAWLLLIGGTSMAIFSGYLMYIAFFKLNESCIYCLTSATCSVALFILAIIGREWEEMGQVFFTGVIVALVTLVGTLGLYANAGSPLASSGRTPIPEATTAPQPPEGWPVTTTSGPDEIALAKHLTAQGAVMYGAFWCPHCYEQKQLFGKEAIKDIKYIECDPSGKDPQPDACMAAKIQSYPSWTINGELVPGVQLPEKLAEMTKYEGSQNFKYTMPY